MEDKLKVGDIFTDNGAKLKVVEQLGCIGCFYRDGVECKASYPCSPLRRNDGKSVIYKKIGCEHPEGVYLTEETASKLVSICKKITNDMGTEGVKIELPEDKEIDIENSDLEKGKIAFKRKEQEIKTWKDLIGIDIPVGSSLIIEKGENPFSYSFFTSDDRSVFIDEKHAKSALAMAQISQLIPFYGGSVTDEEWLDTNKCKWCIEKISMKSLGEKTHFKLNVIGLLVSWSLLAFHTEKQAKEFLKNNRELCEQFYMMK